MKYIIVILMLIVLISLFSAFITLIKDSGNTTRTVKSLTVRIGVSLLIFAFLMVGVFMGWITPHPPQLMNIDAQVSQPVDKDKQE